LVVLLLLLLLLVLLLLLLLLQHLRVCSDCVCSSRRCSVVDAKQAVVNDKH
jgi:hypothetical protein